MAIGRDEVRHVARLARLRLDDAEVERMTRELSSILDHFEAIRDLPVEDTPPLAIAAERADPLRPDEPGTSDPLCDPPSAMAPEWADGFFLLPRLPALEVEAVEGAAAEEGDEVGDAP
jgi:aspartyl/glutamyl-tRNA(Asn/Gln) amidotransferase C subunit